MEIEKIIQEQKLTVKISGRLDTVTAPQLEDELKESLDGIQDLLLDFSDLNYISSAGLRVLLSTQKKMNKQGNMQICGVNETVMEIFDVTGFSDVLTII